MAKDWVRITRVGTPSLRKGPFEEAPKNIQIDFEIAPKPPGKWVYLFHEKVGPARDIPGRIHDAEAFGAGYRGYVSSEKEGVAETIARLDQIIDETNDRFEAFQKEAAEAEVAKNARLEEERQKRAEEQRELDAIAQRFAKPPYQPE